MQSDTKTNLVWVTGAGGLIGSYLIRTAAEFAPEWKVRPLTRHDLDLTDHTAVRELYSVERPTVIIHCAGLTKSPVCEAQPELARKLNVEVTGMLCAAAGDHTRLVFLSTDLVFDGRRGNYSEADPPNPLSVYGQTKLQAESLVLQNPANIVIRTSLNAGASPTGDRSFTEQLRRAMIEGHTLDLFVDEFRTPIHASVTARAVWELVRHGVGGLYHVAGSERLSRWQIGMLLAARWAHLNPKIVQASAKTYRGAPRPYDTSLNCSKAQAILTFQLPAFSKWLDEHPDAEL